MKIKIITPDKLILDQEADSVTLPGSEGEMTILPHHAAMIATLKQGKLRFRLGTKEGETLQIDGGVVEVLSDQVLILTKSAQTPGPNPSLH